MDLKLGHQQLPFGIPHLQTVEVLGQLLHNIARMQPMILGLFGVATEALGMLQEDTYSLGLMTMTTIFLLTTPIL